MTYYATHRRCGVCVGTRLLGGGPCENCKGTGHEPDATSPMRTIAFRHCTFVEYPDLPFCETRFEDGARCPAAPTGSVEQGCTAVDLGYAADVWRMCRDHELAHTFLAERLGQPYSPTLWAVAHPADMENISIADQHAEEGLVLAFQRYIRTGEIRRDLYPHVDQLPAWREAFKALRPE